MVLMTVSGESFGQYPRPTPLVGMHFTFKVYSLSLVSNRTFTVEAEINWLIAKYFNFLHGEDEINMMF